VLKPLFKLESAAELGPIGAVGTKNWLRSTVSSLHGRHAGHWYATALPWRPQVALLVNESTLSARSDALGARRHIAARIAEQFTAVLAAHGAPDTLIDDELQRMLEWRP
jgi:hypothetical protein